MSEPLKEQIRYRAQSSDELLETLATSCTTLRLKLRRGTCIMYVLRVAVIGSSTNEIYPAKRATRLTRQD